MRDRRRTVKELLVEAKDAAELMVDLAYAAIFFGDDDLAEEVLRLEQEVDDALVELRMTCMLAARTMQDAEQLAGVLSLAVSIEGIADSAEDIARVVLKDLGVPAELRDDLRHAYEATARVKIRPDGNQLEGQTLRDAEVSAVTGAWVLAIRRDVTWIHGPAADEVLRAGDVLIVQGPPGGIDRLREMAGGTPHHLPPPTQKRQLSNLDRAVDLVVDLKNISEVAVGLAYSAILLRDATLAAEVGLIENRSDDLWHALEGWVLRAAGEVDDPEVLRGLLHLAAASERIVDAALSMTRIIEAEDVHPIVAQALSEADEIVCEAVVAAGSDADGKTLAQTRFHTRTGMEVLAVQREGRWIYRPRSSRTLQAGDRLLTLGPEGGAPRLRDVCGDPRPENPDGTWTEVEDSSDGD